MVGLPSQLGYQLINDVCKAPQKLVNCCCAAHVQALWSNQLPVSVRAHISDKVFTAATYKEVFESADKCFVSAKQVNVAAVHVAAVDLDETQSAFSAENQPQAEVAALSRGGGRGGRGGRGRGRGNGRGGRGGGSGRGGKNQNAQGSGQNGARGPRHASNPPESCCERHYVHGDQAWYCLAPTSCPWVNKVIARP